MSSIVDIKKRTEFFIKDLHAREVMRLGWYRQVRVKDEKIRRLRERKAHHTAFLRDLLRKREVRPAWYSKIFYWMGHGFGFFSAFLPTAMAEQIENTLEEWILIRYEKYLKLMTLDKSLRSMVESLQLKRFSHDEPAQDAITLLENFIREQQQVLAVNK